MKKFLPILILLVAAVSGFGQQKTPKEIKVEYDKFKDKTEVSVWNYHESSPLRLYAVFTFKGEKMLQDASEFYLYFIGGRRCSGFCFNGDVGAIFLIDGQRVTLPERRVLSDEFILTVDRELFTRIATARLVEFQIGEFEVKWKDKSTALFKKLLDFGTVQK